jgi:hypothetical protein
MPDTDDDRDRRHFHVRDDDDVQPGDPRNEVTYRDRDGHIIQDDGLDLPPHGRHRNDDRGAG